MSMLDGSSHVFGTLCPFGIWNRFSVSPDNLWLESGMLKYSTAYFVPDSYKPAAWQFKSQYSSFGGSLGLESKLMDVILGQNQPAKIPVVQKVLATRLADGAVNESRAVGCDKKTDSVTMINPRGEEATCTYSFVPTFDPPLIPNPSSLGSLMAYVDATAVKATSAVNASDDGVVTTCIKPEKTSEDYAEYGNKVFCNNQIMTKKFAQITYPSSLCSGKLRLYLQCIYGGRDIKYELDTSGGGSPLLSIGMFVGESNLGRAGRVAVLGRGSHFLFTYNYHHFLIRSNGLSVNPLVPIGLGHRLKRWLQAGNYAGFSATDIENLEAYLLSVSFPTYSVTTSEGSITSHEIYKNGHPFDFGLNANWQGTAACNVFQKKTQDNYRITSLVDVSVSCSGVEDVLNEEMERKCESLIKDLSVLKGTSFYPQGVYRRYITKAEAVEVDDPTPTDPFNKKIVIIGDIEDGEWWYSKNAEPGDDQFDELLKQKNRSEGGLPYTKECIDALANCLTFSASAEPSSPWMEPLNVDKIFVWDPYYQDYEWKMGCNPRDLYDKCPPSNPAGRFPVYAWYNKSGIKIVADFVLDKISAGDNDSYPPEGLCGPGHDSEYSLTYHADGFTSGFAVGNNRAVYSTNSLFTKHSAEVNIVAGTWGSGQPSAVWAASCGCGFCDGTEEPTCCGGIGAFFTHWVSYRRGDGTFHSEDSSGGVGHFSFLLIPKDDCQAVHFGASDSKLEESHTVDQSFNKCGNAQKCSKIWWSGTPKVVGETARGWITCFGVYFAKAFFSGSPVDAEGNAVPPDEFATSNWCVFYPNGGEVGHNKCNFRKWGPDGPEDVVVGLVSPWLAGLVKDERKDNFVVTKHGTGYYTLPNGSNISTMQTSSVGTSDTSIGEADGDSILENPYWYLLRGLDLRWPYANCGAIYNSYSTTNKNGELTRIIGPKIGSWPKIWPFSTNYVHPVGYI